MINTERIVPISRVDLLTLYGNIMKLAGTTVSAVEASNPGIFVVSSGSGNKIANEPVKSFDFATGVSSMTVYFVPAFDYQGFKVQGTAVTTLGATVDPDGSTLYTATLSSGDVTIAKVGF